MSDKSNIKTESPNVPWIQTIRRSSGLIEHICKCGVGHPAIGSVHFLELQGMEMMGVHGCCGCCQTPEWKLADAIEGLKIANELLFNLIKEKKKFKEEIKTLKEELEALKKTHRELEHITQKALTTIGKKKRKQND